MTDFPEFPDPLPHITLSSGGLTSTFGQQTAALGSAAGSGVWNTTNTAVYCPAILSIPATVYQMAIQVVTQSGNIDVGIYDENAVRLVSSGSTAVGAAGIQLINITDTPLRPGVYYLAMNCDNVTASFLRFSSGTDIARASGCQSQAVGAVTLPNPATFANPIAGYMPVVVASLVATI